MSRRTTGRMEEVKTSTRPLCQMVGRRPAKCDDGNPQQDGEQPSKLYLSWYCRRTVPTLNAALGGKFECDGVTPRQDQKQKLQSEIKAGVSLQGVCPEQKRSTDEHEHKTKHSPRHDLSMEFGNWFIRHDYAEQTQIEPYERTHRQSQG